MVKTLARQFLSYGFKSYQFYFKWKFHSNLNKAQVVQENILLRIIKKNSQSIFGQDHNFINIHNYSTFIENVKVHEYDDLDPYIQKIALGNQGVLTKDDVLYFEETSGSSQKSKLIPYTKSYKTELNHGIMPWLFQLDKEFNALKSGPSYWSLSPALKRDQQVSKFIPIGVESDSEYFHPIIGKIIEDSFAVPSQLNQIEDSFEFYKMTLAQLILSPNLSFISSWSPSFLIELHNFLTDNFDLIIQEVDKISPRSSISKEFETQFYTDSSWDKLWPNLKCVSCWTHGTSALFIPTLQKILGRCPIQPKGLLSTECLVSIPFFPNEDPSLAYYSHFYEFRNPIIGSIHGIEDIVENETYEIIVTASNGLYRYATGDLVRITNFNGQVPNLVFEGRKSNWTDLVGEKISEVQAIEAWNHTCQSLNLAKHTASAILMADHKLFQYTLYIDIQNRNQTPSISIGKVAAEFDQLLKKNPYYQQAISLKQLKPVQVKLLNEINFKSIHQSYRAKHQIKDGESKFPFLWSSENIDLDRMEVL